MAGRPGPIDSTATRKSLRLPVVAVVPVVQVAKVSATTSSSGSAGGAGSLGICVAVRVGICVYLEQTE